MSSQPNLYDALGYDVFPITRSSSLWRIVSVLEQALACILLVACLPFLTTVCLITVLLSRRSPLIAHSRIGRNGQTIWVFKVRTMWDGQPRESGRLHFVEYLHGS